MEIRPPTANGLKIFDLACRPVWSPAHRCSRLERSAETLQPAQLRTAAAAQPGTAEVPGTPPPRMRPAGLAQEPG